MTNKKSRADQLVVRHGLAESRSRAQALILAGKVYDGTRRVAKAGDLLADDAALSVKGMDHPWASRGGLKLDHGLKRFGFVAHDRLCLDLGASTGGFTDVLLHHGARRVHAVDVGHGQLAWRLRTDARVAVHEKTNARFLDAEALALPAGRTVQAVVCDASFIGLRTILPPALALCGPDAWAIALIKPQFEAGPGAVGKGGVVRDPQVHQAVCDMIRDWWQALPGWMVSGIEPSPITGPEGNREFLIGAQAVPPVTP